MNKRGRRKCCLNRKNGRSKNRNWGRCYQKEEGMNAASGVEARETERERQKERE